MAEIITYVGLDVHKDTIVVALATADKRGEVCEYGTIANTPAALKALASKLAVYKRPIRTPLESRHKSLNVLEKW